MQKTVKKTVSQNKAGTLYGLRDVVTQTNPYWNLILHKLQSIGKNYGFKQIETPLLEEGKVYTDFYKDRPMELERTLFTQIGNKSVAIRSSVLPAIYRHYLQNKIYEEQPLSKWFYLGNVIAQDDRQAMNSNYSYGFEVLGTFSHLTEAQAIAALWDFYQALGFTDLQLEINTLGDATSQSSYKSVLKDYLKGRQYELCDDCSSVTADKCLAVLRCDNLDCKLVIAEAPASMDHLDNESKKHFTDLLEALDELGLPYQLNQHYAGCEGATRTVVSFQSNVEGRVVVLGSGNYRLIPVKNISGKNLYSFGLAGDLSVLAEVMESLGVVPVAPLVHEVYLVPLGELASKKSLKLFRELIADQVTVYDHFGTAGVKNQLKQAEESKAPIALIMGQKEAMDDMVILRDVKSGMQEIFSYDKIIDEVKKRLGR